MLLNICSLEQDLRPPDITLAEIKKLTSLTQLNPQCYPMLRKWPYMVMTDKCDSTDDWQMATAINNHWIKRCFTALLLSPSITISAIWGQRKSLERPPIKCTRCCLLSFNSFESRVQGCRNMNRWLKIQRQIQRQGCKVAEIWTDNFPRIDQH